MADVYEGWVEALRGLGEQVYTYNLDKRLQFFDAAVIRDYSLTDDDGRPAFRKAMSREEATETAAWDILSAAYQCWPDVVLLPAAMFMPPELLDMMRGRGHKVVLLHTESPYQDEAQLDTAAHADVNLLNDPLNIARYAELGPAEYMPHAYRPGIHYPAPAGTAAEWDLAFVGTGFPSRVAFFEQMNLDGLKVRLAGPWLDLPEDSKLRAWAQTDALSADEACLDNDETAELYRRSRCGINFYRRESEDEHAGEGWACGPREIELAACGLWFPRDPRPESDALFPMLPAFTGPAEASEQVRWALAHPGQREKAAARAREAVADRTFQANATRLLKLLDK